MQRRTLLAFVVSMAGFLGFSVVGATPASAASCSIGYLRMSVFTNGYVDGAYIFGPLGRAQSHNCGLVTINITAQPAVVGGVPRVSSPGGCTSPDPGVPVLSPNDAECTSALGYGGVAADATSYPYITLTGIATAVGTDGSRDTWTRSCTVPLPAPDYSSEYCRWGTPV